VNNEVELERRGGLVGGAEERVRRLRPTLSSVDFMNVLSAFILLGSSLIYGYTGLTNLDAISSLVSVSSSSSITDFQEG
jgi:hypothetical protein